MRHDIDERESHLGLNVIIGFFFLFLLPHHSNSNNKAKTDMNDVEYVGLYDADTLHFKNKESKGFWGKMYGEKLNIRLEGLDTPELRTKDDCEKKMGYEAKAFAAKELEKATQIDLKGCFLGKYAGRIICEIKYKKTKKWYSLSKQLLDKGYAYEYWGGTKEVRNWCRD